MRFASAARFVLLLPALAAAPAFGQLQAGSAPLLEQVEVNVVNVDVHVTDSSGKPVSGLGRQDFELLEDGKPVKLTNFDAVTGDRVPVHAAAPSPLPVAPANAAARTAAAPPLAPVAEEQRLHLVLYVDDFNLSPAHRARVLGPLRKFLAERLAPTDRVMVVSYDQGVRIRQPFTSDPAALAAALDQIATLAPANDLGSARRAAFRAFLDLQGIEPCDLRVVQPIESYAETTRQEVLRSLRGLTLLVNSLAGVPGRKAILHVSDGIPLSPGQDLYEMLYQLCGGVSNGLSNAAAGGPSAKPTDSATHYDGTHALLDATHYSTANDFRRLTSHANAQGVPFYTLQASGLGGADSGAAEFDPGERALQLPSVERSLRDNLQDSLTVMATDTGGRAILNANDPTPDLGQLRADFETYYSLGYSPEHHGDGKEHQIEVRVKRSGFRLRYRKGYRDEPTLERAVNRNLATLLHGFEDNPIEITLTVGEVTPAKAGAWQVPVRLRIPLFKLAILNRGEAFDGQLRLLVMTRDGGDKISPVRQVNVPIHIRKTDVLTALGQYFAYDLNLELPPGPHRLAVAVRDEYGGTTSYLGKDLAVGGGVPARAPGPVPAKAQK
jgi:VWFA-related protein